MSSGNLDPAAAATLVDAVERAESRDVAQAFALEAGQFLIDQLQVLRALANGYPRNPINGAVWFAGRELAEICDRFALSVGRHGLEKGEEQATALAVSLALEVMGHYPDQIFPRVLRNAKCLEAHGNNDDAVTGYEAIVGDFDRMGLDEILDDAEPDVAPWEDAVLILSAFVESVDGLERLRASSLDRANFDRRTRATKLLSRASGP